MLETALTYWVEFAMSIVAGALTIGFQQLAKKQKNTDAKSKAISDGVRALLHERIIETSSKQRDQGYCPLYVLETVELLYKQYVALGGNGAITTIVQELHDMGRTKKDGNE